MTYTLTPGDEIPRMGRKIPLTEAEQRILEATAERPPKRGGRGILLVLVLAVGLSVIMAGVWYAYWRPSGASTPEAAFTKMIDAFNRQDAEDMVKFTTVNFADEDERDGEIASLKVFWKESGELTLNVNSYHVVERDNMGSLALQGLDEIASWVEGNYEVEVKDSCAVEFTFTTIQGAEYYPGDGVMPLVKVGLGWYVAFVPFLDGEFSVEPA